MRYNSEEIIAGIKAQNERVLSYIYREYLPSVRNFLILNNINQEEASDIFQDALIIIYRKVREGDLKLSCEFKTYLISVARNLLLNSIRKKNRELKLSDEYSYFEELDDSYDDIVSDHIKYKLFINHLNLLDDKCKKLLNLFLEGRSLRWIAFRMGFLNEQYAKKRKFLCKEKLVKNIQNDPIFKELSNNN